MKQQLHFLVLAGFCLVSLGMHAQENRERRADERYEALEYINAIKLYENIAKKGYVTPSLLQNLGNSYYFNAKLEEAHIWYAKLFELEGNHQLDKEYYYRYAQTLKGIQDYNQAAVYLDKFAALEAEDLRAIHFKNKPDYLKEIAANSDRFTIKILDVNSLNSDYGSAVYKNNLIFTSSRQRIGFSKKLDSWTKEPFTSLYSSKINGDGSFDEPKEFASELHSRFNESTAAFTKDGKTMYFTRNNYSNGKLNSNSEGITLLKIYKATLVDGKWNHLMELPFNSEEFSTAHPVLSADNEWMYFSSDREGGFGQSDLYRVAINPDGSFGEPTNLGDKINTPGRETFPFITSDNELYYATDGFPGLGGLDIYGTKIKEDGSYTEVQNLGAPLNSPADDFGYYIDAISRTGFISSNREGNDQIYSFIEKNKIVFSCDHHIIGKVYDQGLATALPAAQLSLYDVKSAKTIEISSDAVGEFHFKDLLCGTKYRLKVHLDGYNTAEVSGELLKEEGTTIVDFGLTKNKLVVKKGDDLFKILQLEPIYFDYNKSDIRTDATLELAKIVAVMEEFPKMTISIRSHSDSRGNDNYNLKLSDARAKATAKWIINEGINASRIKGLGLGETVLLNRCNNTVNCTEEEHQMNRRSEFIVEKL